MTPSAFFLLVQDMRLCKAVSQDGVMAAYEAATTKSNGNVMTCEIFIIAIEALLYQDFVETGRSGNNPLSWIAHISRATTMTPRGLAIRKAVSKIATLFGYYGPSSRTTTIKPGAYAHVFQHAKQKKSKSKVEKESVMKLAYSYNKAAIALIDDDDERVYEATDHLKSLVASMRGVKSYWKILQTRTSKKGAINAVKAVKINNDQAKIAQKMMKEAILDDQNTLHNIPLHPNNNAQQMSPKAKLYGQRMFDMQKNILTRKAGYYESIGITRKNNNISQSETKEDKNQLLRTHSQLFSLRILIS